jgi:septum formation protein
MMNELILASASPRRKEIFREHGFDPAIMPADIEETLPFSMTPRETVMFLSMKKAFDVLEKTGADDSERKPLIVASDTIVFLPGEDGGEVMGKPKDEEDAFRMLSALRSNTHLVISGVCITGGQLGVKMCFSDTTKITFGDYSDEELRAYLKTPEAYDKAGAYAIQGTFEKYVTAIDGSRLNVVGFPWEKFEKTAAKYL